ncbi:MAG: hypothetical protein GF311_27645 [Candidatus Lokiarchaeota archaeon]|nr:hypothetical protein [Candidatus Lokiarchaeota archaeon]
MVESYLKVKPNLPEMRRRILVKLLEYHLFKQSSPTSQELAEFIGEDRSNISNRLSELAADGVIYRSQKRPCQSKRNAGRSKAVAWVIGDDPTGVAKPSATKPSVVERYGVLVTYAPQLKGNFELCGWLLGCSEKHLKAKWKKRSNGTKA